MLASKGIHGTTAREIAKKSGVSIEGQHLADMISGFILGTGKTQGVID